MSDAPSPRADRAAWRALATKDLKGADPDTLVWETPEGIAVKPLYTAADLDGLEHADSIPGAAPFVRGVRATMYAERPWTIRQYAGFSTAEESNAFYRRNLAAGQKGLSVAFDLATHRGYDSDHPRVVGDVGKAGVAIDSVEDMKILFDGIPLDKMSVSMTMNGAVLPVLAGFIVAGEEQGVAASQLGGTIQNDILKEFMVRNTYIYPPEPSMRIVADIIELHGRAHAEVQLDLDLRLPHAGGRRDGRPGARLHHRRRPRSTCGSATDRGLDIDAFAPRLSFFFAIGMNFFMEVAKLRAARLLWDRVMAEFEPKNPQFADAAHPLPDLGRVAHRAGPVQQRRAHHRRGAGRGAGRHPEPAHQRLRRGARPAHRRLGPHRPQHPADPRRGDRRHRRSSTRSAAATTSRRSPRPWPTQAWALIEEVEALGGMTKAVESGMPKLRIEEAAARRQARVDRGEEVIVGVNKYRPEDPDHVDVLDIDNTKVREQQVARLEQTPGHARRRRVRGGPRAPHRGCRGDGNLLALCIDAARARATVGEMSDAMEAVFGRHQAEIRSISGVYGAAYEGDEDFAAMRGGRGRLRRGGGPPSPHARGQDGPGRPRPGRQGHRHRVRRPRLRRRRRPAVPDARRGRPRRRRERRARGRRVAARPPATRRWCPQLLAELRAAGGDDILVVLRRGHPAAGLRRPAARPGVVAIFGPGTNIPDAAATVLGLLRQRHAG